MSFMIGYYDSLAVQRLKLIYLIPYMLLSLVPLSLEIGLKESIKTIPLMAKGVLEIINGTVEINHLDEAQRKE
jgi:hypothetical protein